VENVPQGSTVVVETGRIHLPSQYKSSSMRQLRERDFAAYRSDGVEYLIASSEAYGKYLSAPQNHPREYAEYMQLFGQARELKRFPSSDGQPGPEIVVLKVKP
jgi:hypothetical protein